jgi:hypothetical protein
MTSQKSVQSMDDYLINPFTKRLIKKNSKTYERLLNAKLLNVEPSTPQENTIITMNTAEEAKDIQKKLTKNIQPNKIITRRGSVVSKASRRPTRKETIDKVTDIAIESIRDHREHILESEMNDNEMDEYIKKMIAQKLVGNTVPKTTKKPIVSKPIPIPISTSERARTLLDRLKKKQVEIDDDDDDDNDNDNDY